MKRRHTRPHALTQPCPMRRSSGRGAFASVFESELGDVIPVVHTSVAGTRIIGRMTTGNKHGLLLPSTTTDQVCSAPPSAVSPTTWP